MRPNYGKESFGAFMNSYGQTPVTDTCHNYGSMSGCDFGCPALIRGDCKVPEWIKGIESEEELERHDLTRDEYDELLSLYMLDNDN